MRSLRTKMVMILVLLILALMTVVGSFLINGVGNYYIDDFYDQMNRTFSQDFILQLQELAEDGGVAEMKQLLMSQADLGIDLNRRNVYILDQATAEVLDSSNQAATVGITANITQAMNGQVGERGSIASDIMDLAVPVESEEHNYIVYILDNKLTVDALTGEVFSIILQSLVMGLVICVVLAFLLSQILITPIRAMTTGTRQVAAGDYAQKLEVTSRDEIGTLTKNFNHMAQVLQNTISEVENERNKLSTLFLHMTDGVVAFDRSGQVIHCNPAAVRMLSRGLDTTVTYDEVFGADVAFEKLLSLKRSEYLECQKRAGDRELELFLAPISSAEASSGGVMAVIHDVTEQRKSEQTRREFIANVSHELRTPLTNVKSYAETIISAGDELPAELRSNFMGVIVSEADRMTRIVKDLLTLSKFDYGKMEMNIVRFSFSEAVGNVYKAVALAAQGHGHTFTLECPEDLPEVNGDRERIEQVIMNVVSNAIKYTADGGKITITAGTSGKNVFVKVSDNGVGIPEKDLPNLFERFYRVDKARSRATGGTGLGLSIAKEILAQHKGDIRIESVYGEGTDVTVTLPAAE